MNTLTYQFKLGEYQGFVIHDASSVHSADELVANPDYEELGKFTQEYSFELDEIPVDYNNLLIKVGNQNILVDTGIPRPMGKLSLGLGELGIGPGEINMVIITHADRDHIGGILDEEGDLSFPNARYVMLKDAWQYWSSGEKRAQLATLNKWTEEKAKLAWNTYSKIRDLMLFVKSGEEFLPGLQLLPAPGHRYDHSILKVTSSGDQLIHIADALAHPLFMAKREWYSTYDANPAQAIETKIEILKLCASEKALVFGAHFPFPGLGYVQQERESWKWQPIHAA